MVPHHAHSLTRPFTRTRFSLPRLLAALLIALLFLNGSASADGGDFSLNFKASAPFTYNHDTGGGAWNDGTNGEFADIRPELEGVEFRCGDQVSFLTKITVDGSPTATNQTIELVHVFTLDSTGQTGAALHPLGTSNINYGQVENGDDYSAPNPGIGVFGLDGGINDDRQGPTLGAGGTPADLGVGGSSIVSQSFVINGSVFGGNSSEIVVTTQIDDFEAGEVVIFRLDMAISCKPGSSPTGNLQAKLDSARVVEEDGVPVNDPISVGAQTVPFKKVGDLAGASDPAPRIIKWVTDAGGSCPVTTDSTTIPTGGSVLYCYELSNDGVDDLFNVTLIDDNGTPGDTSDDIDLTASIVGLTDEDGDTQADDLAAGASATAQVVVGPSTPSGTPAGKFGTVGTVVNTVTLCGVDDDTPTPTQHCDTDTATVHVVALTISKLCPTSITGSAQFDYDITVNATGPVDSTGIIMTDPLPAGVAFVSVADDGPGGNNCSEAGGTVTCNLGTLSPGTPWNITITVAPNGSQTSGNMSNTATAASAEGSNVQNTCTSAVPVSLAHVTSGRSAGGTLLQWTTTNEFANLGFNVYEATPNGKVKLNGALIPSQVVDSFDPVEYSFFVADPTATSFYIEDVDFAGKTRLHGPFDLGESIGAEPELEAIDWLLIQAEHDALAAGRNNAAASAAQAQVRETRLAVKSGAAAVSYPLYDFQVSETSLYRATYEDMLAAGLDLAGVPAADIALTNMGQPVPIRVVSGYYFGSGAYLEFYGEALDSLYTATNVYQLVIDPTLARRVVVDRWKPRPGAQPAPFYMETLLVDDQNGYSRSSGTGDPWYLAYLLATEPQAWTFDIALDHFVANGDPGQLGLTAWSETDFPDLNPDHHVIVELNGAVLADERFEGRQLFELDADLPAGLLNAGNNVLTISLPNDSGAAGDLLLLENYSITYPRAFVARDNSLTFAARGDMFRVDGLTSPSVVAYRLGPNGPIYLEHVKVRGNYGVYSAYMAGSKTAQPHVVATADALRTPTMVPSRPSTDISSGTAQFLIIAHPNFLNNLTALVDARQLQGFDVRVVNVDDVYAQFGHAIFGPEAIANYLAYAQANMATEYVLLVGGDTYDYRDYLGYGSFSFIPTPYAQTGHFVHYAPADPLLADTDGDAVPDLALGRFPVRTQADLDTIILKTLQYDARDYGGRAVFAADRFDGVASYSAASERLAAMLPAPWSADRAYLDTSGVAGARTTLLNGINMGTALTAYVGHSGFYGWTFAGLFNSNDAANLTNYGRPTIFAQFGCWNTYYATASYTVLGHRLLMHGNQGAAAVMGPTTLTRTDSEMLLGDHLMPQLVQPGTTIGQALLAAKRQVAAADPTAVDVILGWTILGDPTLKVAP